MLCKVQICNCYATTKNLMPVLHHMKDNSAFVRLYTKITSHISTRIIRINARLRFGYSNHLANAPSPTKQHNTRTPSFHTERQYRGPVDHRSISSAPCGVSSESSLSSFKNCWSSCGLWWRRTECLAAVPRLNHGQNLVPALFDVVK